MGFTHFDKVAGVNGLAVGDKGVEKTVANASGHLYAHLVASETKDWGSLAAGASATEAVTVTGAALGDFAVASMNISLSGLTMTAYVSAANTVTVVLANNTGSPVDLAPGTLYVAVLKNSLL